METQANPELEGETIMIHGCVERIPTADIRKHREAVATGTPTSRGSGWFGCYILGLALLAAPLLRGQEAQPAVMAGTKLCVQFNSEVGTATSHVNDGVEVHLLKPVEAEGREVLPVGTILTGRVLAARKGDTHKKVVPVLRLAFEQVRLPNGRTLPVKASLADLGILVHVDSEGAATPAGHTKSDNAAAAAGTAGVGAGVGAIAGGGSGAAKGAGIGAGIGILGDILTRNDNWEDFTLKRGRKAWLRLDQDLVLVPVSLPTSRNSDTASKALPSSVAQQLPKPSPGEYPEALPRQSAPTPQPPPSSPII